MSEEDLDDRDAAAAFADLENQIKEMRGLILEVYYGQRYLSIPDFTPTLQDLIKKVDAMSAHPAMRYSPTDYKKDLDAATRPAANALDNAEKALRATVTAANSLSADIRNERKSLRWFSMSMIFGIFIGVILAGITSEAVVRYSPRSWLLPEYWSAHYFNMTPWSAGQTMMFNVNPSIFGSYQRQLSLFHDQYYVIDACEARAQKFRRPQKCVVVVDPPAQTRSPILANRG